MSLVIDEHPRGPERADLSNWCTAPFSRWAFRNVRQILPTVPVDNTRNPQWVLPSARCSLDKFRLAAADGSMLDFDDFLHATATDALVVLLDGRIVHEFYCEERTEHTPHILMSASKAVVGLIAGILCRSGALDVDALVSAYVPEIAHTAYRGATIRHLLDMRTGISLDDRQQRAYDVATNWEALAPGEAATDLHCFFQNFSAPRKPHGGLFHYVSANIDLLGWVMERATGKSFAALLSELLWSPMGAEDSAYITVDREGAPRCTGGLCATARDFARIGQLVLQNGSRDHLDIVPAAWIDDIQRNGDRDAWREGEFAVGFAWMSLANMSYRSGWFMVHNESPVLFALGIYGQNLFIDRAHRLVIAKLSSQGSAMDIQALPITYRAVAEIGRCLLEA